MQTKGLLNAFHLKVLMALLMVLDHIHYYFPRTTPFWFTLAGRLVAPVFAFLMTQGLIHTRDRKRYVLRLAGWGCVMLAGNLMLGSLFGQTIPMDIFFSLAVSAGIITLMDMPPSIWRIAGIAGLWACSLLVEGSFLLPVLCLVFYLFRHNRLNLCLVYAGVSFPLVYLLMGRLNYQLWQIAAIVPILLYNGQRGPNNLFTKYFFYLFYPLHIWVIYIVKQVM